MKRTIKKDLTKTVFIEEKKTKNKYNWLELFSYCFHLKFLNSMKSRIDEAIFEFCILSQFNLYT